MKKTVRALALVCVLLMAMTAAVSAQTVEPVMPEMLRSVLAGKTFVARMDGYACDEAFEHVTLNFQICEQETYTAEAIEALAAGDVLVAGGEEFAVKAVKTDEYGIELTGEWYSLFLYKNEDGLYTAVTDTENRFYKNLFGIEVPAPKDLRFVDWSDPEAEEPTVLTLKDLMTRAMNDEINSTADNTEITFDAEGRLSELVYRYSPWN